MNAERHELYEFTMSPHEAACWASIVSKLVRPRAGFQRPTFTSDELEFLDDMDQLCNPDLRDNGDGPQVMKHG